MTSHAYTRRRYRSEHIGLQNVFVCLSIIVGQTFHIDLFSRDLDCTVKVIPTVVALTGVTNNVVQTFKQTNTNTSWPTLTSKWSAARKPQNEVTAESECRNNDTRKIPR